MTDLLGGPARLVRSLGAEHVGEREPSAESPNTKEVTAGYAVAMWLAIAPDGQHERASEKCVLAGIGQGGGSYGRWPHCGAASEVKIDITFGKIESQLESGFPGRLGGRTGAFGLNLPTTGEKPLVWEAQESKTALWLPLPSQGRGLGG
jgi:hypothetical protein